jgi:hypothetical protein
VKASGRLDWVNCGQRCSNGELENNSRKPRDLLKTGIVAAKKESTYSFSGDDEKREMSLS